MKQEPLPIDNSSLYSAINKQLDDNAINKQLNDDADDYDDDEEEVVNEG